MTDVLVVGAGPAGAVAATILARAGVAVRLVDRARFPRDKFCGDTLNPGVVRLLHGLRLAGTVVQAAARIDGMLVTGPGGVRVQARYRAGRDGRALLRKDFDASLLQHALAAGAQVEEHVHVRAPIVEETREGMTVRGVTARGRDGRTCSLRARVTIAADGRRSAVVAAVGLGRTSSFQRWAAGAYFSDVEGLTSSGEMHIRGSGYIGVAPIAPNYTNVCVVTNNSVEAANPAALVQSTLRDDPVLCDRFRRARPVSRFVSMGPLARDVVGAGMPGLLLAGDAAGFVDPMTGDGLRFAVRGGALAAEAAQRMLGGGRDAHTWLARRRRREFWRKYTLDRVLRWLVASPQALTLATIGARVAPWTIETLVRIAGDEQLS